MTFAEIKQALQNQFGKSVVENDELPDNQVEIDGKDWLNIATFMKEDP